MSGITFNDIAMTLPNACPAIMESIVNKDGSFPAPLPFPLPLPDMPAAGDMSDAALQVRVHFAEDKGFLTGLCFMIEIMQGQGA